MRIEHVLIICACLAIAGCPGPEAGSSTNGRSTTDAEPQAAPPADKTPATNVDLKVLSWEETQELVAEQQGKIVVLDAWSTSCGPCMKEFPNLVRLHEKHGGKDVVCMSMSVDYVGIAKKPPEFYRERVLKFLTKQNATFENILLNQESDIWYESVDLAAIPAVFVFDRAGKLVKRFDNDDIEGDEDAFTYENVNQLIEKLLAQQ